MSQKTVYLVDIMKDVVNATALAMPLSINYTYGPIDEIVGKLVQMSKNPVSGNPKYPLVALVTDIREELGQSEQIYSTATFRLLIVNKTDQKFFAEKRTETSFKQVLHPIFEELQNQLRKCHKFDIDCDNVIPMTKFDRYNWGRSQSFVELGQGAADFIDAVDLTMTLRIKAYNCNKLRTIPAYVPQETE